MKRILTASMALSLTVLTVLGVWWTLRSEPVIEGPSPVPIGETVSQVLPGSDGEPEVWTLRKRKGDSESAMPSELPSPSPRGTPPDARTESARTLNGQALEAWKHGEIRAAQDYFEEAIEQDPDDWLPRADYGRLLVLLTRYETAGPHLERAAALNPDEPRVWLDLYSYYQRTLQIELALDARRQADGLAGGRAIEQDQSGIWRLEGESIFP